MARSNEELAREAYAAINRGDLEGFLELIHPDVEFTSLISEAEGGAYRGHDGVREWWSNVAQALGGLRFEPTRIHEHGDSAYVELVVTGTLSGVEVPQRMWQALRRRGERAVWWGTFRTEAEAREALGLRDENPDATRTGG